MKTVDSQRNVLSLFNSVVIANSQSSGELNTSLLEKYSVITDFKPDAIQTAAIADFYRPLAVRTLFTRNERDNASLMHLLTKQILHYIETYGFNSPGLFGLEVEEGTIINLRNVTGITVDELSDKIRTLIYSNAPLKDALLVKTVIKDFAVSYDINKVANNELKVVLFDESTDSFLDGDDAVRYMVYQAVGNPLLIKSPQVIDALTHKKVSTAFLERHERVLAKVFNRHKRLIIAAKSTQNKTAVNRIARLSKSLHVPVREPLGKRIFSEGYAGKITLDALAKVSVRDKFKVLNLIEYKRMGNTEDAFVIRNGKIHIEPGRGGKNNPAKLDSLKSMILNSLKNDLGNLSGKRILLDSQVDYGLPISRKQAIGNLPFGTAVAVTGGKLSAGIYWENDWGARDLDLSTIDNSGNRTGWGSYSGYSKTNPVTFSGDITSAHNGAMEFMTSEGVDYGLFVNIFSGSPGSKFELVVGRDGKDRWITNTVIREKSSLDSRGNVIGFVKNRKFIVYQGRLNGNRWSSDDKSRAIVSRGTSEFWTVSRLLDEVGVEYSLDRDPEVTYDYDLSYSKFSYDRLEELLLA